MADMTKAEAMEIVQKAERNRIKKNEALKKWRSEHREQYNEYIKQWRLKQADKVEEAKQLLAQQ